MSENPIRKFEVSICDKCVKLEGKMCHTPECVFIRCTMDEVRAYLDRLMIRPIADGEFVYEDGHAANEIVGESMTSLKSASERERANE